MMEFQTFFISSENHSRVFRRCTNSCQCPKFPSRLMYLQFVFPSRVVSGGAGSLSAYVYFPTTRRSESDRRGGGGNRGPWEEQEDGWLPTCAGDTILHRQDTYQKHQDLFKDTQPCNTDLRAIVHECTAQRVYGKKEKKQCVIDNKSFGPDGRGLGQNRNHIIKRS